MKICLDGTKISFKTKSPWFELERDGLKCNTVRRLNNSEIGELLNYLFSISEIEIIDANDEGRSFTRLLSNVSYFDDRFVFSWQHRDE